MNIILKPSTNPDKKWMVVFENGKKVHFGGKGYSDYTLHRNPDRMRRYLARHSRMGETWTKNGMYTAGFWSRWLLWSEPSLPAAKKLIKKKFGIIVT